MELCICKDEGENVVSRRRRAERRVPLADPRHSSVQLSSFINRVMLNGKKTVAQRAVYQALDQVASEPIAMPWKFLRLLFEMLHLQ